MNPAEPTAVLESQLLTLGRVAWVFNVSEKTIERWVDQRELDCFQIGHVRRFAPEAVLRCILRHTLAARSGSVLRVNPDGVESIWRLIKSELQSTPQYAKVLEEPKEAA